MEEIVKCTNTKSMYLDNLFPGGFWTLASLGCLSFCLHTGPVLHQRCYFSSHHPFLANFFPMSSTLTTPCGVVKIS